MTDQEITIVTIEEVIQAIKDDKAICNCIVLQQGAFEVPPLLMEAASLIARLDVIMEQIGTRDNVHVLNKIGAK